VKKVLSLFASTKTAKPAVKKDFRSFLKQQKEVAGELKENNEMN
jgi:hypothetical protein